MTTSHTTQTPHDDEFDDALAETVDPGAPLLTDADVLERVRLVVQTAYVERWWLLLLDEGGVQLPVVPQIEMPLVFGEARAEDLAGTLLGLSRHREVANLVVVWELPRSSATTATTRASMLAAATGRIGLAPTPTQVIVRRDRDVSLWRP